jgi:intracellular septation protein A
MSSEKVRSLLRFAFNNFGPIIVFYGINHFFGLKAAIAISTAFSVGEIVYKIRRGQPITGIFKYTAIITVLFGMVDLCAKQSFLFRYESVVTNVFTGIFFGASIIGEKSVIHEYYENTKNAKPLTRAHIAYFRMLTGVWVVYFFAKAFAYFWIAGRFSLEEGLVIRTLLGSGTFYVMLAVSIYGSRKIFPLLKSWGLLPSAEEAVQS